MKATTAILLMALTACGHMQIENPAPIRSPNNPYTKDPDYNIKDPLNADGSNFPCKNYHLLLDTPEGTPTAGYKAGGKYSLTLGGSAFHNGGSCQISLSYDKGKSFKVIKSFIGNCPPGPGPVNLDFTIPSTAGKHDRALLAWTWNNNLGNREYYMNCASVNITGDSSSLPSLPNLFVGNLKGYCSIPEMKNVEYPDPGKDVQYGGSPTAYYKPTGCKSNMPAAKTA